MYFPLLLTFLFVFSPHMNVVGIPIPLPYLINLLFISYVLFIVSKRRYIDRELFYIITIVLIALAYLFFNALIRSYIDAEIMSIIAVGLINIVSSYCLSEIYTKHFRINSANKFIEHVFYATSFHALIMVTTFFIPSFSNAIYSVVVLSDVGKGFIELGVRSPGLTGSGGDHLSVIQALGFAFGYSLLIRKNHSLKMSFVICIGLFLNFFSIMLSARSGYVLLVPAMLYLTYVHLWNANVSSLLRIRMKPLIFMVVSCFSLALIIMAIFTTFSDSPYVRLFNRTFEFLITYQSTGEFSTSSTDAMSDMYFLPTQSLDLIFGLSDFGRNESTRYYLDSDIGYVRSIYGSGILGTTLIFSIFPWIIYRVRRLDLNSDNYGLVKIIMITIAFIIIFNFKVFHLFSHRQTFKVLFTSFFIVMLMSKSKEVNRV